MRWSNIYKSAHILMKVGSNVCWHKINGIITIVNLESRWNMWGSYQIWRWFPICSLLQIEAPQIIYSDLINDLPLTLILPRLSTVPSNTRTSPLSPDSSGWLTLTSFTLRICNCDDCDNLKPSRSASEGPLYCPIQVAIENCLLVKSKNEKDNSKCFDFNVDDQ